jgi:hypothetical protein
MHARKCTLLLVLAALVLVQAESVWAASRGGGGGRGGGSSAGTGGSRGSHGGGHPHYSGGRHHHHGSHSHWNFGFAFGGPWWYPSYSYAAPYYYPPPAYYPPATYYVPPPQTAYSSESDGYWYYCPGSKSFYPYVTECAGDWQRVEPRAPPPGSDNVRTYSSP